MSSALHVASVPVFVQGLGALKGLLHKAEAYCAQRQIDQQVLLQTRLFPNMFAFGRQVQVTCDFAKNAVARLAGQEPERIEDTEASLAELIQRVERTLALVQAATAESFAGAEGRPVQLKGRRTMDFANGQVFLHHFALPNFWFHLTTAYNILRMIGVDLGKMDYMGQVPGLTFSAA